MFIAGDLFDDGWRPLRCPPELISFAIDAFSQMGRVFAVPGQHDLPNHSYDEMKRSAYWVLHQAGSICNLTPEEAHEIESDLIVMGVPWGFDIPQVKPDTKSRIRLLIAHKYIWNEYYNPANSEDTDSHVLGVTRHMLQHFDAAAFGDNHMGFLFNPSKKGLSILNCGRFIPQMANEIDYVPTIGILYEDGSIVRVPLDAASFDQWDQDYIARAIVPDTTLDPDKMNDFIESFSRMASAAQNFGEAVTRACRAIKDKDTVAAVMKIVEGEK